MECSLLCLCSLFLLVNSLEVPIATPFDEMYKNCPGKVECNLGMDAVCKELGAFIKSISPIKEVGTPFCESIEITGTYTIKRTGDVWTCKLDEPEDCSVQQVDLGFDFMNFTCKANVEFIIKKMEEAGEKLPMRKRSPMGMPKLPPGMNIPTEAYVLGHWLGLEVLGKIKLCKKDDSKNEAVGFHVKEWGFDKLEMSCSGDPKLEMICQGEEGKKKIKEAIGATVQPMLGKTISNGIMNGPANIGNKFTCEYANGKK